MSLYIMVNGDFIVYIVPVYIHGVASFEISIWLQRYNNNSYIVSDILLYYIYIGTFIQTKMYGGIQLTRTD